MKNEVIIELHKNFEEFAHQIDGEEYWFARELQGLLGYTQWRNFEQVTPTLRAFQSGEDGFEAWASLRVGMRLPPGFTPADWYARLSQLVGDAQVEPLGFPVPAYQGEKNTALVRAFLAGIRLAGGKPGFVLKSGTADLNILAPAWGCPAVAYGPGDSSLDHTPDEHIQLSEYVQAVRVLQAVLAQITQDNA